MTSVAIEQQRRCCSSYVPIVELSLAFAAKVENGLILEISCHSERKDPQAQSTTFAAGRASVA